MWAIDAGASARLLLVVRAMRSLPARLLSAMVALLGTTVSFVLLQGCMAAPDAPGGQGETTYSAEMTSDPEAQVVVGDDGDEVEADAPLIAVNEDPSFAETVQALVVNASMRTTANLSFRKGPGTSYSLIAVIPSGTVIKVLDTSAQNGYLNVEFNGTGGWAYAAYLATVTTSSGDVALDGAASPDNAIARAKAAIGFSYYWGGGAWRAAGATSSTKGSCSGSCPSCSHSGSYGADCSGLVAKAWQFGTKALEVNSHPYSTADFVDDWSGHWSTVSRSSLRKGDALVYNDGTHGHIVIYEKGDGWGTPTVIECRGCSYGCVYNARSFTSNYKGIRRAGF